MFKFITILYVLAEQYNLPKNGIKKHCPLFEANNISVISSFIASSLAPKLPQLHQIRSENNVIR